MIERTMYSTHPIGFDGPCCEEHTEMGSPDHIIAASSFTKPEHEYDEGVTIPAQRFGLLITVDRASVARKVQITPEITMLLLDQFAELVRNTVGPESMAGAMLLKVMDEYGAEVMEALEDETPQPQRNTRLH